MGSFTPSAQWRSMALAAMVHGLLLAFLWVGVRWQSQETTAVEAEVWDMTTRQAAPKPIPVEISQPEPEKEVVKVLPKEEPLEDPEIALMQEKKRKLIEKKKQEELNKLEREKELKAELKAELKKEKLAEQKKKTDEADAKKKLLTKDQSVRDKVFAENMRRLAGQAGNTGTGGTGDAAKSTGNNRGDASYAARIAAKVRSNTVFNASDTSSNNPTVEYRIDLLPDGSLRGVIRKLKSSGVPAFDDAVEKAIEKSLPFPRDKSGDVPASIVYVHKMKE
jgi:colicin import membrane protein